MEGSKNAVECPICQKYWPKSAITTHVNSCLNRSEQENEKDNVLPTRKIEKMNISPPEKIANGNSLKRKRENEQISNEKKSKVRSPLFGSHKSKLSVETSQQNETTSQNAPQTSHLKLESNPERKISPVHNKPRHAMFLGRRTLASSNTVVHETMNTKTTSKNIENNSSNIAAVTVTSPRARDPVSSSNPSYRQNSFTNVSHSTSSKDASLKHIPLAQRMRPKCLDDYVGQEQVLGKNSMLRTLLQSQQIPSMILWGPPGCGKTTLARIIAQNSKKSDKLRFAQLSATTSGVADVKEAIKVAKNDLAMFKRKTLLFIDEIHRFNKLQQDTFLPHVEEGTITLIGATTENPSFQVNNALLSRCRVIVLEKLSVQSILLILNRALKEIHVDIVPADSERTPPEDGSSVCIREGALHFLADMCDGDARGALNSLQTAVDSKQASCEHSVGSAMTHVINIDDIKEVLQKSHVQYDRAGEEHYNCASAFQKSIRGSNDNGAIYWLARMLEGGEDPLFIARRLVVTASEDIGLADSQALPLATATFQACQFIGMPECAINLAHCTTYLARAAKSTESHTALHNARVCIRSHQGPLPGVPLHLRNAPTRLMKNIGYGKGYKYNPSYDGPVEQDYLPTDLLNVNFFDKNKNSS